jgi:hypothetical protein
VIEPRALEITRHTAPVPVDSPLTIAHLTDLHTRGTGMIERAVLAAIADESPDLIVVTGDTEDGGSLEGARDFFSRLRAPLGVWVVRGNWEHWRPAPGEAAFFASVGAHLLVNDGYLVRPDLFIAGLDDSRSGQADLTRALRGAPEHAARLALFHSPEAFDEARTQVDLALAGHTHGGQVRVPWLGALWVPPGSGRYEHGWYRGGRSRMYVSRGVGTSQIPVRLFCRPELAFITLAGPPADRAARGQ